MQKGYVHAMNFVVVLWSCEGRAQSSTTSMWSRNFFDPNFANMFGDEPKDESMLTINFVLMVQWCPMVRFTRSKFFKRKCRKDNSLPVAAVAKLSFPSQSLSLGIPGAGFWNGGPEWPEIPVTAKHQKLEEWKLHLVSNVRVYLFE